MYNKLGLSFKSADSAQQCKDFLNGIEDQACECDTFNYFVYVAVFLGCHAPSSHLSISYTLYNCT